jgi:hypothetical protein
MVVKWFGLRAIVPSLFNDRQSLENLSSSQQFA